MVEIASSPARKVGLLLHRLGGAQRKSRSLCRCHCKDLGSVKGPLTRVMAPFYPEGVRDEFLTETIHEVSRVPRSAQEKGGQESRVSKKPV